MDKHRMKYKEALSAARAVGINVEEVKPVLKRLIKVFEMNWELIEQDNYQALLDAYFDSKENERAEDATNSNRRNDTDERPTNGIQGHDSGERRSKKRQIEEEAGSTSGFTKQPQPSVRSKEAGSGSQPSHVNDKGKKLALPPVTQDCSNVESRKESSHSAISAVRKQKIRHNEKKIFQSLTDIAKGTETVKISLVDEIGIEKLPRFNYIPQNLVYEKAHVRISLARIADEDCCSQCDGNCLSPSKYPCACAGETGGVFAYTPEGLLKEEFLKSCMSTALEPKEHDLYYCNDCPYERAKNESRPERCKGHLLRRFIKECWRKCGCDMQCGNRIVQRGITHNLQVFSTQHGKGWGLRTLEDLPMGTFVCEYVGEILTNTELYERNLLYTGNERHTYPVMLDADWCSERILRDDEALCLDATLQGNVARFVNHRCYDANLIEIPVQVETPDRHYYHLAFFTTRKVEAFEELSWDYGIDFDDENHPIKAFRCCCQSANCRDKKRKASRSTTTKKQR